MRKLLLLPFLLLSLTLRAGERESIDAFIRSTLAAFPEAPGLSVAVIKDGKPILVEGYGMADLASKRPMTATTPVYIASSTKSYTGLLCAILAGEGKLDLDTPIVKYLPELKDWPEAQRITLRKLLTHSAGLTHDGITTRTAYTGDSTPGQLIALLPSSRPVPAGFRYDNYGYVVASLIVERVTGKRWQNVLSTEVFAPLGMSRTTAYVTKAQPWGGLATGYTTLQAKTVPASLVKTDDTMHAAGGIVTNANDLSRWVEANLRDGRLGESQALPAAAFQEAHKKQIEFDGETFYKFKRNGYGFGWYWSDYEGELLMHHFGGFNGWRAHVSYMPAKNIGVAVVSNNSGSGADVPMMVAAWIYDFLSQKPGFDPVYTQRTAELRKQIDGRNMRVAEELDRRSKRAPSLTRAPGVYAGAYSSPGFGTLVIRPEGEKLTATLGPLHAPLEAFTEPETARLELVPGSGEVLRFSLAADGLHATEVKMGEEVFVREGDAFAVHAAGSEREDIEGFIRNTLAAFPETPGLSVAVVKDGKPFLAAGYGFANLEEKRALTAATPVYIGSSTKSYTGLLMAVLAQKKIVDLDVPIVKYLPELDAWPDSHRVTLRILITHSAGLENEAITTRTAYTGEHTTAQLLALLPSSKSTERRFQYDNFGYVVAALIAEKVTGKKWQDLLATHVFSPLGMDHTSAYMSATRAWGGIATPYSTDRERKNIPSLLPKIDATMHAAGGIVTNANDLSRWLEANLRDGKVGAKQAVPAAAVLEAHKRQIEVEPSKFYKYNQTAYGFGWYWSDYEGNLLMQHMGGYEGWRAHVSFMPEKGIGVAVVTNTNGLGSEISMLVATYIYDRLLNRANFDPAYAARTAEMRKAITDRWGRVQADYDRRSKRTWTLTKPLDVYTGSFASPDYGTIVIRREGETLVASIGQLHATLEPFTQPETARVELIPGSGEVLTFALTESGEHAASVKWGGTLFTRAQ